MTSVADGLVVEEDSFNSTSYFDNLKLNSSCKKSWVELMEEEEMEEEYSRSPWASLTKTEGTNSWDSKVKTALSDDTKLVGAIENVGTAEVPAVIDRKPASPLCDQEPASPESEFKPLSPMFIKRELEEDKYPLSEEVSKAASVKCEAHVKQEPLEVKVKAESEDSTWTAGSRCSQPPSPDEKEFKNWNPLNQNRTEPSSSSSGTHKRRRRSRSPDSSRKREPRYLEPSQDEKKEDKGQCSHDQNPAELLFNFESVRKRRHSRKNSDEGSEGKKRGVRYWDRQDDAKKQRRNIQFRDSSTSSSQDSLDKKKERKPVEYEKDPVVLARRQKQIDYGKNTIGYDNYLQQVPKLNRTRQHPRTPPKYLKYSRRAWDGMVRIWRQQLHLWDSSSEDNADDFSKVLKDDKTDDRDARSEEENKEDVFSVSLDASQDIIDIGL